MNAAMQEQAATYEINRSHYKTSPAARVAQTHEAEATPSTLYTPPDPVLELAGREQFKEEAQPNPYWRGIQLYSQIYGDFFLKAFKHPIGTAAVTDSSQFLNALVTMLLHVLLLPMTVYLALQYEFRGLPEGAFTELLLKPVLWLALFMFLLNVYTYAAVRLSSSSTAKLKEVMTRFGVLMIPFLALYLIFLLFLILNGNIAKIVLILSVFTMIMAVPVLVLTSYKRRLPGGLDPFYAILAIYVATLLTVMILGDSILQYIYGL
ncbi:hypothetical protein JCM10914A_20680 [Paenibacillus sp. JCM 10914]